MQFRPTLAVLALLATPAAAQPAAQPAPAAPRAPATAATPATTPAPMPDPLMSPVPQAAGRPPTLAALVAQSAMQDAVVATARAQFKSSPDSCATPTFKPTGQLTLYAPPVFDPNGVLAQGMWSESVAVTGCPTPQTFNVLTMVQPGAAPVRIPTMPGTTHADPATQKAALQYAQAIALRAAPPGCKQLSFVDTKFDGFTGLPNPKVTDGRDGRAWNESWTLFACGALYDIHMTFTPNADGTQLVASNPVKRS